nr:hypothetical protein [uncultured Methanospirillum sp.]
MTHCEERICPFISSGRDLVSCLKKRCTACRSVVTGDDTLLVCLLIDRELYDSYEVDDAWI